MNQTKTKQPTKVFYAKLIMIPIGMFAFSFALIPLYEVICDITGLNGRSSNLTQSAQSEVKYQVDHNRDIKVKFLSSVAAGLPIKFYPKERVVQTKAGQVKTIFYIAENRSNQRLIGQAVPSVAPEAGALHFKKLECFCFNRQVFEPNQRIEMPVQFVVESDLPEHVQELNLSYTFFRLPDDGNT